MDYATHLWQEKEIKSVANICRADVEEFLKIAVTAKISPRVDEYGFMEANRALVDLKTTKSVGAKVLVMK